MRILVIGTKGQVSMALQQQAALFPAHEVVALGRPQIDLERPGTIPAAIAGLGPQFIVNAAAYTAVDRAEQERSLAFAINRDGATAVAAAARGLGVPLVHLSTDYVYAGDKAAPYAEDDPVAPAGVYGASKLAGEVAVRAACPGALILRTAWVYSPFGQNFVKTMLRLGAERDVLRVVDDQQGSPTAALDIADAVLRIAPALAQGGDAAGGLYHLAGSGFTTWCGLARHVFAVSGAQGGPAPRVEAITTADYPTPARRPANSRLDTSAFARRFGFALPHWQESVAATVRLLLARRGA